MHVHLKDAHCRRGVVGKRHEDVSDVSRMQFAAGSVGIQVHAMSRYSTIAREVNVQLTAYSQPRSMRAKHNFDMLKATDSDHPNGSFDTQYLLTRKRTCSIVYGIPRGYLDEMFEYTSFGRRSCNAARANLTIQVVVSLSAALVADFLSAFVWWLHLGNGPPSGAMRAIS